MDELGSLHVSKTGHGPEVLLLFHGFGQDHRVFLPHLGDLVTNYTVFSFDLFFHGQSTWKSQHPIEKTQWKSLLLSFLDSNKINRFSVLGFSLGGKLALASAEMFPDRINELFLLAPDGVKLNAWYRIATSTSVTRWIFHRTIDHVNVFTQIARVALKFALIEKGVLRFAESQMNTAEKRSRVYNSWVIFRRLSFSQQALAQTINASSMITEVYLGKHDRLIPQAAVRDFMKMVKRGNLHILEAGHNDLLAHALPIIAQRPKSS